VDAGRASVVVYRSMAAHQHRKSRMATVDQYPCECWFENDPGPRTDLRAPFDEQAKELSAFVQEVKERKGLKQK
jgi:hypothetical protein